MKCLILTLSFAIACQMSIAQQAGQAKYDPKKNSQEKMTSLAWMKGRWEGEGWIYVGREKTSFKQLEIIESDLNNTILKAIGVGVHEKDTVHRAFAIMFFDHATKGYKMNSFIGEGENMLADASLDNNRFIWTFKTQGRTTKFTIRKNEKGQWEEDGEMVMADGKTFQFFHMILDKKS